MVSSSALPLLEPTFRIYSSDDAAAALQGIAASRRGEGFALVCGDALEVLRALPTGSIDFCMTSPPYWGQRDYDVDGIGLETTSADYVESLVAVFAEVYRLLKPTGSLWLNIGDAYAAKSLLGLPWRLALRLTDDIGFKLRNEVIWHKVKGGPDNSKDKLRNMHEHVFHFARTTKPYFNVDAIRSTPRTSTIRDGKVISATGVSGVRYNRQIDFSTVLSEEEKANARAALKRILEDVAAGKLSDFRMIIRGQQRATHSDKERVSGRARELKDKGFYFLKYHPNGTKPGDVWDIIPVDTHGRAGHFAAYPEDLCKRPILATCPPDGIVLDPFCGTGTTLKVARDLGRGAIGVDLSPEYLRLAWNRCSQ
jgi:site-specific DNA-methyltransferase (adenine-specific)